MMIMVMRGGQVSPEEESSRKKKDRIPNQRVIRRIKQKHLSKGSTSVYRQLH